MPENKKRHNKKTARSRKYAGAKMHKGAGKPVKTAGKAERQPDIFEKITGKIMIYMMALTVIYSLLSGEEKSSWYLLAVAIIVVALILDLKVKIMPGWYNVLWMIITPLITFLTVENYTHLLSEMRRDPAILNIIVYYLLFLFLLMVIGQVRFAYPLAVILLGLAGLINYFVILFRSSPVVPWDIYSIGVAASVADNFEYTLSVKACIVVVLLLFYTAQCFRSSIRISRKRIRIVMAPVLLAAVIIWCKAVQTESVVSAFHIDTTLFTPKVLYRNNGLVLGFVYDMQYLNVEKPEGYDEDQLESTYDEGSKTVDGVSEENPNIIVVMNEAFSDLRVLGYYTTNTEVMPFIDSLTENTRKGWMYSSVKGGNTANTEFEFLTNQTLQFLPVGSVAYQQYIRSDIPSLASQLGSLGYTTIAMHPYNASGWNRDKVYDYFGFDQKYFLPSFTNIEYIRNYASDATTFNKIIDLYENKSDDDRLFVFDVTMQNHGSYTRAADNLTEEVSVTDRSGSYLYATNRYLSLIRITDQAFEDLVEYFEDQDEPTIILMFGDHQPADYVVTDISDTDESTLEGSQKRYIVPYIMWANYDIEESQGEETSANYLSTELLDQAGIELTGFQEYLEGLQDEYPVITGNMLKDSDGNYYERESSSVWDDISSYADLQYNNLVDTGNRIRNFFSYSTD